MCLHRFSHGTCKSATCEIGQRVRSYFVLAGAVLTAWQAVEKALSQGNRTHIQIVRIRTSENQKLVGVLISPNMVSTLIQELTNFYQAREIKIY